MVKNFFCSLLNNYNGFEDHTFDPLINTQFRVYKTKQNKKHIKYQAQNYP